MTGLLVEEGSWGGPLGGVFTLLKCPRKSVDGMSENPRKAPHKEKKGRTNETQRKSGEEKELWVLPKKSLTPLVKSK